MKAICHVGFCTCIITGRVHLYQKDNLMLDFYCVNLHQLTNFKVELNINSLDPDGFVYIAMAI